ncbi:MAG: hypothetical protein VYA84_11690 [Planctomycetota bacterium]|nr:hypothetical protein [Planctomycetota bacterium]
MRHSKGTVNQVHYILSASCRNASFPIELCHAGENLDQAVADFLLFGDESLVTDDEKART